MKQTRAFFNLAKKLDELVAILRDETGARAALVLVLDDDGSIHFTVQGRRDLITDVPALLVHVADTIYEDLDNEQSRSKH